MNTKTLRDTSPWNSPENAAKFFREILGNIDAREYDRLLAAELAGDFTVINDDLADGQLHGEAARLDGEI